jgi:Raf kinase inhibitor-like YbhB/YbcL family protein
MIRLLIVLLSLVFMISYAYPADFVLKSSSFANNQRIPKLNTCDGGNVSPQFSWEHAPAGAKSFVLVLQATDWLPAKVYGWVLYNIPPTVTSLAQGANKKMPDGVLVGMNYYYESGYIGPCPPDKRTYHYTVTVYALDKTLDLSDEADADDVMSAMNGHIIKQASYVGIYSH